MKERDTANFQTLILFKLVHSLDSLTQVSC